MSDKDLTPEEVLLLAQAALSPGAPVKVRSYVKRSPKGKQVVVRQAIRGAAGGTGRTPILPSAQTTPVISDKALKAEAAAARAGAAVERAAHLAAQRQAAAALKAQKQAAAAKKKQAKANKTKTTKAKKAPAAKQPKTPKVPRLGGLGALGALHGGGGGGTSMLRGRPGRLFPGSRALGNAIARSKRAKAAKHADQARVARSTAIAGDRAAREARIQEERAHLHADRAVRETQRAAERAARGSVHEPAKSLYHTSELHRALYKASARKVDPQTRKAIEGEHGRYTEAAHRALELAAAYRRAHAHGKHSVGEGFHEKLAGEIIKHEAKRLASSVHLSNADQDNPVILAQEALRLEGYPVEVTGEMNDETSAALAQFLLEEGVDIDACFE